jgi:hypothetical protein
MILNLIHPCARRWAGNKEQYYWKLFTLLYVKNNKLKQ